MVNLDNVQRWTQELRTTEREQVNGYLGRVEAVKEDGTLVISNCCLGIGTELAGIQPDKDQYLLDEEGNERTADAGDNLNYLGCTEFPPDQFFTWLGVHSDSTGDLVIDWPTDGFGNPVYDAQDDGEPMFWTASQLNDNLHLSFSQIADVVDYFGVSDA